MKRLLLFVAAMAAVQFCFAQSLGRDAAVARLASDVAADKPIVAHIFVPLCDNENQGIVPTTASLGNGLSLRSNLYWATSKGMKRYFVEQSDWKLLQSVKDVSPNILERVVFRKSYSNGATVYLVVDAWRGDRMKECLELYFKSLSGGHQEELVIAQGEQKTTLEIGGKAHLLGFNGHNGLMDTEVKFPVRKNEYQQDAVVIACASESYFEPRIKSCGGYPLVTTTSLLYPGAPVMEFVVDAWIMKKPEEDIKNAAGDGYHAMKPKVSTTAARRMFSTGYLE